MWAMWSEGEEIGVLLKIWSAHQLNFKHPSRNWCTFLIYLPKIFIFFLEISKMKEIGIRRERIRKCCNSNFTKISLRLGMS